MSWRLNYSSFFPLLPPHVQHLPLKPILLQEKAQLAFTYDFLCYGLFLAVQYKVVVNKSCN